MRSRKMSDEKKTSRKFTVRFATDEDYKRMNFYTIGTLYRTKDFVRSQKSRRPPVFSFGRI
jgi:hypothetical protein